MSYDYGPNSNLSQYRNEAEHRAGWWLGQTPIRPRSLFAGDPTVQEPLPAVDPPIFSDSEEESAPARPGPSKKRSSTRNTRVQQPAPRQNLPSIREALPDAFPATQNPAYAVLRPEMLAPVQDPIERPQHIPRHRNPVQRAPPLAPAPDGAPLEARIPGGMAAVRRCARPNGNAVLDALDDIQPDPVYDILAVVPIFDPTTGLLVANTITLKSNLAADEFRARICNKMGLDPATANLGFKTTRDKQSDLPRTFNTEDQVKGAILSITRLIPSARTKEVKLLIDNLTRRAHEAKAQDGKSNSRKRSAASSTADCIGTGPAIAASNRTLERLESHLVCNSSKCKTPGVAGKNKYCFVQPDGTHTFVGPELRFIWADLMDKEPAKYTVYNPPNSGPFDPKRTVPGRARPQPAATPAPAPAPIIHVHLSSEALEPARKRRRVLGPSNVIDLTIDDDDNVKVKVPSSDDEVVITKVEKVKAEPKTAKAEKEN
ncbi:hypothetical protein AURDEDRAFT_126026 [Auricularia subglabra TFB-10046 SS5]|nr:hypothetical protein AURDEDRAFT_126026 [Auricularia subglabra TFB-10046 SS5]